MLPLLCGGLVSYFFTIGGRFHVLGALFYQKLGTLREVIVTRYFPLMRARYIVQGGFGSFGVPRQASGINGSRGVLILVVPFERGGVSCPCKLTRVKGLSYRFGGVNI